MLTKISRNLKILAQNSFSLLLLIVFAIQGCKPKNEGPHPVEIVIGSMSDTLPVLSIPEDEDPESENWKGIDLDPKPPVLPLYPDEEASHFLLPPGYKIEPILTEPEIEQPGAISFDGNGRMYVLELRTYMLTADSDGTLEPVSRISRWEDRDKDGTYETGGVFVDSLIFPRFVLPYGKDAVLTMNSDEDNVYKYSDTNGDGKADKKEFFTNKYGRSGNVEHQQAFMYWGMDNWLYSTVNAFRVKETPGGVIREKTGYNRAQWGITHDDDGKLWFLGGASGVPSYFQFPIHYGTFKVENQFAEGFEVPWGAPVKIADMQGGMDEVRQPDGSLNRVTGSAGNDIYRGDRLPAELYGQLFYGEPVARIVRQINPVVTEGLTKLHNVYQDEKSEFLRSTDPLFRPVDMATAPDGTMYVVDMYHGIIQEGQWAQKGTYLRTKIEQYQLDKVIGLGRIWRITHEDTPRDKTVPRMYEENPSELVKHLEHPNGWWRDKAQQLIVMSQDRSVVPELEQMVRESNNLLARFHALWSLEGLGALDRMLVRQMFKDQNHRLRIQALRASETLYKGGDKELAKDYRLLMKDTNVDVAMQAMLTANITKIPALEEEITALMASNKARGIQVLGDQILNPVELKGWMIDTGPELTATQQEQMERGSIIFNELCVQCHGLDGAGTSLGNGTVMAPSLRGSPRVQSHPEYVIKTLLHGLEGPLEGQTYPGGLMVGMGDQSDDWIADIASYIRVNLTNEASIVSPEQVAEVRLESNAQKGPYLFEELLASVPQILVPTDHWKVSASHTKPSRIGGTASPSSAFNFEGWTTGERQSKGMWYEIEFPDVNTITEIHFNSPPKRRGNYRDRIPPYQSYPRSYEVQVSMDGTQWDTIDSGECDSADTVLSFAPSKTKFLRFVLTDNLEEEGEIPWSMRQLKIFGILHNEKLIN
ncbi:MAG: discoidin domain-containing protein [Flavobacteriaceae bacterium]|nr:MAG: discoidin domain-containing protein [Flavobacteriaceae bacterium]